MRSALDPEELYFCFGGFFLFAHVSMVGMVTTPANPGSFLIAAFRLTNLARSSKPGFCPDGILYVSPLVDQVVGQSSDDELHIRSCGCFAFIVLL